ncbi:MAG: phosphoserine transaminase [Gammaproteobacteria bacterium]
MQRAYNFNPGPCRLPDAVMEQAQAEFCDYQNLGASVMELSHRGEKFIAVHARAESLLRELLNIPNDYAVLFLSGGATGQAAAIPLNLAEATDTAAYLISGHWSRRAANEGKKYCRAEVVADDESGEYKTLPTQWQEPQGAKFFHYADNETVHGTEFAKPPQTLAPLVADMSSNIASRMINIADYGIVYAGAQKNLGAAGVTIVIVRKDLIRPRADTPMIWHYPLQIENDSMANTPPSFNIYLTMLVLEWLKEQGGVPEMESQSAQKSQMIYQVLDTGFYRCHVADASVRSRMNIPFFLPSDTLTADFLRGAEDAGLLGLKGHAVLGGCRASLYNATTIAATRALSDYLADFARRRG